MTTQNVNHPLRIAFISTRIQGTDGVSLEITKWTEILEAMGHSCFFITGASDRDPERCCLIPEAHFTHSVIEQINYQCFGCEVRSPTLSGQIHEMTWVIKEKLHAALKHFEIDLIIAENCVTIPMNIPLGLAVVEIVMETGIACIAHHHDFIWERERFLVNAVDDFLRAAFPPMLRQMQHVSISTQAASEFSRRTGLPCRVIPNAMDFEQSPKKGDGYGQDFRSTIGVGAEDVLILQPTRIIPRKNIESAVELVRRLEDLACKLVITHASGDEGGIYAERIHDYAELLGVEIIYAEQWIASKRGIAANGQKRYTIWDAYPHADFVSYPSAYEGFGNAFLEAIYYKKPILCNRYAIYRTDIEPCGFKPILMDGFLTDEAMAQVRRILSDKDYREQMVEHNYEVARKYFSYSRVETELRAILAKPRLIHPCVSKS